MTESDDEIKIKEWLAIRKEAGRKIDPNTAEVMWCYQYDQDPYGIDPELPEELRQVGREYFARSPGSDVWVWFGDIPNATWDALWEKHRAKLAFPAGLPQINDDETVIHQDSSGKVVVHPGELTKQQAAKLAELMAKQAEQINRSFYEAEDTKQ